MRHTGLREDATGTRGFELKIAGIRLSATQSLKLGRRAMSFAWFGFYRHLLRQKLEFPTNLNGETKLASVDNLIPRQQGPRLSGRTSSGSFGNRRTPTAPRGSSWSPAAGPGAVKGRGNFAKFYY